MDTKVSLTLVLSALGLGATIGAPIFKLSNEVAELAANVRGINAAVELERDERKEADRVLNARVDQNRDERMDADSRLLMRIDALTQKGK